MSTNNAIFFILLAILAGMGIPLQASLNSRLAESVGQIPAAVISFGLGWVTLLVFMLLSGVPLSNFTALKTTPVSYMVGGFFGAVFVGSMVYTVPRIGVALSLALTIGGQMLVAIVIDHFGWVGMQQKELNVWRLAGVVLITLGVVLIKRF